MTAQDSFRAVFYDLDGLMVDTEYLYLQVLQIMFERRGFHIPEAMMKHLVGYDVPTNLRDLKAKYNLNDSFEALLEERQKLHEEVFSKAPIEAMEGFWELDAEAHGRGLKRAVVTSSNRRHLDAVLIGLFAGRPNPVQAYFDALVCSDDVARTKPAPDLYLCAAQRVGFAPAQCLAFEDSPAGLRAARAAGVPCVAVLSPYIPVEQYVGALAVVNSLREAAPFLRNGREM
jgi:pseudouridine-5'-monophosphatase